MSGPDASPVRVETRFERYPASIRGAFVMRGADGNPHAVRMLWARLVRLPGGPDQAIPVEDRQVDVAPARDLFVPFEAMVTDLEPGWYRVRASIQVDAGRTYDTEGRPFAIPWARSDLRRGTVVVGASVAVDGAEYVVDRVDLGGDCAVVSWREARSPEAEAPAGPAEPPPGRAELLVDGDPQDGLPIEAGGRLAERRGPGEARSVTYPVPREARSLAVVIALPSGARSEPVPIRLP